MIKFESNAHWYGKDGGPQHDADLRVARKKFLYPSVTTIDKDVFKNDFLDKWKLEQLALAASTTFKQPHEDDESYCNRIYELSLEKVRTAAEFGKALHDAIENYPKPPKDQFLLPWIDRFRPWFEANVCEVQHRESILCDHDLGVAGRCDLIALGRGVRDGQVILLDYKSQNVKKDKSGNKKPAFYDSWTRQLAFYAVTHAKKERIFPDIPTCVSLVFDSNEPSDPFEKVWSREEIVRAYYQFCSGAYLWFSKRSYWPNGRWEPNFPFPMP